MINISYKKVFFEALLVFLFSEIILAFFHHMLGDEVGVLWTLISLITYFYVPFLVYELFLHYSGSYYFEEEDLIDKCFKYDIYPKYFIGIHIFLKSLFCLSIFAIVSVFVYQMVKSMGMSLDDINDLVMNLLTFSVCYVSIMNWRILMKVNFDDHEEDGYC